MKPVALIASLVVVLSLSGCATEKKYSHFNIEKGEYSGAVEKRLRTANLYKKFDTIMIADVIYNDEWLRTLWVEEQVKIKRLGDDDKKMLLRLQKREDKKEATFILCVYTSEDKWNDFSRKDSRWSVLLESANGLTRPTSIIKVRQKNLQMRDSFPFNTTFREFYSVTFLRDKIGVLPYKLLLSSPLGSVKFTWSAE